MHRLVAINIQPRRLLILALLVLADIGTTIVAQYVLGKHFIELGSVNSLFIKNFGDFWYIVGYPVEFAIFGITTILFYVAWPDKVLNLGLLRLDMWGLTNVQLLILIGNNVAATILGYSAYN